MERFEPPYVQMGRLAAWDRGSLTSVMPCLVCASVALPRRRIGFCNPNEAFRALFERNGATGGCGCEGYK